MLQEVCVHVPVVVCKTCFMEVENEEVTSRQVGLEVASILDNLRDDYEDVFFETGEDVIYVHDVENEVELYENPISLTDMYADVGEEMDGTE